MLELDRYQDLLGDIEEKGAKLIAISPELPQVIKPIYTKKPYTFDILSDQNNEFAKSLGILYEMDKDLNTLYKKFGIDLETTQGNSKNELPVPVTMVVDKTGTVKMIHFETDHTKRFEPENVFNFI